ncbi:hypothetical protein LPJ75_002003 [Coemansia sp. RSA 2598]|nr:hypothetical protein LPJ75_002003 [Coemansia sp. RSA 2598]
MPDSMDIIQIVRGDGEIVNIVEGHPCLPLIAVSGIDSEVHLFSLPRGGPSPGHRRNFPLVREHNFSSIGISDAASKAALMEMIYAPDPYFEALCYSRHSLLPVHINPNEVAKDVDRRFPVISKSRLDNKEAIIDENEDMRFTGLAHTSLTRQIMTNIVLGSMFSGGYSDTSSDNYGSPASSIWNFAELESYEDEDDVDLASGDRIGNDSDGGISISEDDSSSSHS